MTQFQFQHFFSRQASLQGRFEHYQSKVGRRWIHAAIFRVPDVGERRGRERTGHARQKVGKVVRSLVGSVYFGR